MKTLAIFLCLFAFDDQAFSYKGSEIAAACKKKYELYVKWEKHWKSKIPSGDYASVSGPNETNRRNMEYCQQWKRYFWTRYVGYSHEPDRNFTIFMADLERMGLAIPPDEETKK